MKMKKEATYHVFCETETGCVSETLRDIIYDVFNDSSLKYLKTEDDEEGSHADFTLTAPVFIDYCPPSWNENTGGDPGYCEREGELTEEEIEKKLNENVHGIRFSYVCIL